MTITIIKGNQKFKENRLCLVIMKALIQQKKECFIVENLFKEIIH